LNPSAAEERYRALFYVPLHAFLHSLLHVLLQIANKMAVEKHVAVYEKRHKMLP
jgi:hypothetical protein